MARYFAGLSRPAPGLEPCWVRVIGRPGLAAVLGGAVVTVLSLDVADGRVASVYVVRNPDELARGEWPP
jgi:RNA polymerase sigma-70 factor, ECF subfamily